MQNFELQTLLQSNIQINSKMSNQGIIDYFKLFKIFDLKKLQKTGQVKLAQDKHLNRKVLSVQGNVSTNNFISLCTLNHLNIPFNQKYLYLQAFAQLGKNLCFQLVIHINGKIYKIVYSTLYKILKQTHNYLQHPLQLKSGVWTVIVIDLYEVASNYTQIQEIRLTFRLASLEIRATSKIKGIFQSDTLYTIDNLPKELIFPLKKEEDYFETYDYVFTGPKNQFYQNSKIKEVKKEVQPTNKRQSAKKQQKVFSNNQSRAKYAGNPQSSHTITLQDNIPGKNQQQNKKPANNQRKRQTSQKRKIQRHKSVTKREHTASIGKNESKNRNKVQMQMDPQQMHEQMPKCQPKPSTTLDLQLLAAQGISVNEGSITAVGSYLTRPSLTPLHKAVQAIYQRPGTPYIAISYVDGSICYYDTIRKKSLFYFKSELKSVTKIVMDQAQNMVCVGLDKMRRQVIMIVSCKNNQPEILFQQVSNFQIQGVKLYDNNDFKSGIITFGYQNVRLWRVKQTVISGYSIYLGQLCRKNTYTDGITIGKTALLVDSNGFLTKISLSNEKMEACNKLQQVGIDKIVHLSQFQNEQLLTCNIQGTVRIYDMNLNLQTQFMLDQRIKHIVCSSQNSNNLILTYYSKTVCEFNMQQSTCSFILRGHTAPVKAVKYHSELNILTSISQDSTIRMWLFNYKSIKQEFQFRINGHALTSLAMFNRNPHFIVGFDDGIVRKISLKQYKPIGQVKCYGDSIVNLIVSANDKLVLSSTYYNAAVHDSDMNTLFSYDIIQRKQVDQLFLPLIGFNESSKFFYIQESSDTISIYNLKNPRDPIKVIRVPQEKILKVQFKGIYLHILCHQAYYLYENGNLISVLNLHNSNKLIDKNGIALSFPLVCMCWQQRLFLRTIDQSASQKIIMPQNVQNIQFSPQQGLIFCSGTDSASIYAIKFQARNLPDVQTFGLKKSNMDSKLSVNSKYRDQERSLSQNQFLQNEDEGCLPEFGKSQISLNQQILNKYANRSNAVPIVYGNYQQSNQSHRLEQPSELKMRSIYEKQQQILDQCQQLFETNINHEQNNDISFSRNGQFNHLEDSQNQNEYNASDYCISGQAKVQLIYGAGKPQAKNEAQMNSYSQLIWNPDKQYLLLPNQEQLIFHYFKRPVRQTIVDLPFKPNRLKESLQKYIAASIMGNIRIYIKNSSQYFKSLTLPMDYIMDFGFSVCQNYLIAIGTNNKVSVSQSEQKLGQNIIICVMQIVSGNTITLSYLTVFFKSYRNRKVTVSMEVNLISNRPNIQFLIYTQNKAYFYRVSSIMTLQMQQLQNIQPIVQKSGNLISASYCKLQQQQILLFGTQSGSIVIIDARSATILVLCVSVLKGAISKILLAQRNLVLLSYNSPNIVVYENVQSVKDIVNCIQTSPKILTLDSPINCISGYCKQNDQIIILSDLNTLWLIDFSDFMTIKVLSYHHKQISSMKLCSKTPGKLLTGGKDGFLRETSLQNLQQYLQIYKPRKIVKDIIEALGMLIVAFDDELYFYAEEKCLGSCGFKDSICSVRNIAKTTNFIVITVSQILVIYVVPNQNSFKLEKQSIAECPQLLSLQINQFSPFDMFLTTQLPGKLNVWTRKCLKRVQDPVIQLSKVHELQYYLVDTYTTNVQSHALFISKDEYIIGQGQNALIQIRNFMHHTIIREISFQSSFTRFLLKEEIFYLGDKDGFLSIVNAKGFTINKIRVSHRQIEQIITTPDQKLLVRAGIVALVKI